MNLAYAKKLGFWIQKTNVDAQKIDASSLDTFEIVITSFQLHKTLQKARFFKENFLIAKTKMDVVLGMFS